MIVRNEVSSSPADAVEAKAGAEGAVAGAGADGASTADGASVEGIDAATDRG
jgi:hypothetical protein